MKNESFYDNFMENIDELSKDDWKLHKQLIKEGVNPNEIAKIIRNDEIEKLQEISSQANFDFDQIIKPSLYERCSFVNQEDISLIDYAAFFGSVKCFKYLLMNDANIENTGKYAVAGGNLEIIHICEKNHSSFKGAYKAAIEFHRNDIFKYLYEEKIEGHIPFNLVGDCIVYSNYDILQILFKKIIYIEPIKLTVSTGNLFLTEYFLQENQSNLKKDYLFSAIKSGNYELVNYLIDKYKFDINFPSKKGTPIIIAVEEGFTEIIKILLKQKGIDLYVKNKFGKSLFEIACDKSKSEIVKLFLESKNFDINHKNRDGETNLMHIAEKGYTNIFKLLIENGVDINAKDNWGDTALQYASLYNSIDIVKILLEQKGIDINNKDKYGRTALIDASRHGNIEIVKLLLEQEGIDLNAKNSDGRTALIVASKYKYKEIVELLLMQKGIDIDAKDNKGKTALMYANKKNVILN